MKTQFSFLNFEFMLFYCLAVPPTLSPQCKHRGGYSVRVFWEEVPGVWTSVKINIAGNDLTVQKSETELQIDQLQPAKTYKGSLVSMSGSRQSERVEFYCSTDPAGWIFLMLT